MKVCANIQCRKEFDPTHGRRKYCCHKCCTSQAARNWREKNKDRHREYAAKWAAANPEKAKKIQYKNTSKQYRAGRLPKWMYS